MRYKGNSLELKNVQAMFSILEQDMLSLWTSLMQGSQLHVNYKLIAEDLANRHVGYSFLEDPRNPFSTYRCTFAKHILNTASLRSKFTRLQGTKLIWKRSALQAWLAEYSQLSLLHLLRCEMLSGGPSRGTELTAMMYRTGKGRSIRNLVAIGPHLVMLKAYAKTSAMMGSDRLIPHSLDGFEADLLVQDLVLARPFAEFAIKMCWPEDNTQLSVYQFHLFVKSGKLFSTTDLSNAMSKYTLKALQLRLTVHDWRHISIAWRRKLCPTHIEFMDEDETEDHIAAEQTGHTAHTERLKYAISAEALAGPSEDVLPLFLQASGKWQQEMKVVPGKSKMLIMQHILTKIIGGLGLSFLDAQAINYTSLVAEGKIQESAAKKLKTTAAALDIDTVANAVVAKLLPIFTNMQAELGGLVKNAVENAFKAKSTIENK